MGYRDEREAERARIDALERDLAEAKERAERAEADAAVARAQASAAERQVAERSAPTATSPRTKKTRAERKRDKSRRAAATSAGSSATTGWPDTQRRRYHRASFVLSLAAYCATGVAVALTDGEEALTNATLLGAGAAIVAILVGHVVIGLVTRAPGIFNGTMVTLLSSSVALAGAMMVVTLLEDAPSWLLSGKSLLVARIVGSAIALILGSLVTSYWSSDAASSGINGD